MSDQLPGLPPMSNPYLRLTAEAHARSEDCAIVENALHRHNMAATGDWSYHRVTYFLRDDADRIHGGVLGGIWGGWLHVTHIWVADALRGQGFGSRLLATAEDQARQHGCRGAFLQTHTFEAYRFCQKRGYAVVGTLPDYPAGHSYCLMRKLLTAPTDRDAG